jgi:Flp pilus assembly protein TadD
VKPHSRFRVLVFLILAAGLAVGGWVAYERSRDPDRMLRRGREAIGREDWDAAEEYADRLIVTEHRDHGRLLRGESLYKQHRPESAYEVLNRVHPESPLRVEAARTQAFCLLDLGQRREVLVALTYVLEHRPDDLDANRVMAVIAFDQGNWIDAEAYLRKVAELAPADGRPHWTLGVIHRDLSFISQAEENFREALARDLPGELPGQVRADLAQVLAEQKRYAEALEELDRAQLSVLTPTQARLRVDCLRSLGRTDEALALADAFLARKPDDPGLLAEMGLALMDARRVADAVPILERALSYDPHDRRARTGLVLAYQRLGRRADAQAQERLRIETDQLFAELSQLTKEAMQRPRDAEIRRKMAAACYKLNKPDLARSWELAARTIDGR